MKTKNIGQNIIIDLSTAVKILETKNQTGGIWRAKQVVNGETRDWEQIYLETNGDPDIAPHADYPEELALWLETAGVTLAELEAAIGQPYSHWCS